MMLTLTTELTPAPVAEESTTVESERLQGPLLVASAFTGIDSHLEAPQRMRITNQANWEQVWFQSHNISVLRGRNPHPLPAVDFSRFMIIGMVEKADLFPNGIAIARISTGSVDTQVQKRIEIVTVDYHSPGKTEQFQSGAKENVYAFFVIPRYELQLALRHNTQNGWKEVERFHALSSGSDITASSGSKTSPDSIIAGTTITTTESEVLQLSRTGLRTGSATEPPVTGISQDRSRAINIGFAYDPGQGNYDGVVGSSGEVWNFVDIGTTAVDYLRHPNASGSTARLRVTRHDGEWAVKTDNQIFRGYIYHNCQCVDLEATLLDVAPGHYRAFVYAHGDTPNQNASIEVVVGERTLGKKATAKDDSDFRSSQLKEGVHYVTFDFELAAKESLRIISHRDGSGYSMLNAIQLVPLADAPQEQAATDSRTPSQDESRSTTEPQHRRKSRAYQVVLSGIVSRETPAGNERKAWVTVRGTTDQTLRLHSGQTIRLGGRRVAIRKVNEDSIEIEIGRTKGIVWKVGASMADSLRPAEATGRSEPDGPANEEPQSAAPLEDLNSESQPLRKHNGIRPVKRASVEIEES
tara:strand:- start:599 stop:2344 length:1746 start_codon:yes stop_codon:yes gene_type:complete